MDDTQQHSKKSSKTENKAAKDSKQEDKAKKSEKASDKGKKSDKARNKGKKRDMDDLRSKLPPDLQGKVFDMSDMKGMDMDSLKAKIEAMKLEKQGDPCPSCMQVDLFRCKVLQVDLFCICCLSLSQLRVILIAGTADPGDHDEL